MSSFFSYSLACRFWPRPLFHGQESMAVSSTGTQFAGRGMDYLGATCGLFLLENLPAPQRQPRPRPTAPSLLPKTSFRSYHLKTPKSQDPKKKTDMDHGRENTSYDKHVVKAFVSSLERKVRIIKQEWHLTKLLRCRGEQRFRHRGFRIT